MKFKYQGFSLDSKQKVQGLIESSSKKQALNSLDGRNIEVTSLEASHTNTVRARKVKKSDLVVPFQELSTLVESGVTLMESIVALSEKPDHPLLAKGFAEIAQHLESGASLSDAMKESDLPLPGYVIQLTSAGELSGRLSATLLDAAKQLQYEESVRNDIRSALTYPMVLIASGIAAMLIIFFAVVPNFSHMLDGENDLPTLAYVVLSAGKFANDSPLILVFVGIAIVSAFVVVLSNKNIQTKLFDKMLSLPVIGDWLAEQDAARWSALCAAMLQARVNLNETLALAALSSGFQSRKRRAEIMVSSIEAGEAFSEALKKADLLPATSLNLIRVGDKTGKLPEMLAAVSKLHDESCKRRMKKVLTILEPAAILIVGGLIGVMIMGIVLAITASTDIAI